MVRTQNQLTEEQVKVLKQLATSRHVSITELIRRAVDKMINTSSTVDDEERVKRAQDIIGKFSSGKRDVSRKHDSYFVESLDS